jgi:ubiquinone/menaquinone biosynthesis C-methylase UbiE
MGATHQDLILDQFTRQASPFSAAAMITDEAALGMIVEAAQATSNDMILDVACGPGLVVCAFAPHVRTATGIDVTLAMLDQARQLAAKRRVANVAWHQGDAYSLPYSDGSFTVVVTRYSLHHLLDPLSALREMARVCVSDGRIVVVDAYAPEDPVQAYCLQPGGAVARPVACTGIELDGVEGLVWPAWPSRTANHELRAAG